MKAELPEPPIFEILFYFIFSYILSLFFLGNTKRRVDQFENM